MKRLLSAVLVLAVIVWLIVDNNPGRAQGQPGPEEGAVLKLPGSDGPARPAPVPAPNYAPGRATPNAPSTSPPPGVLGLWNNQALGTSGMRRPSILERIAPPAEGADPNQDVLVKHEHGPWMVSIICYTAPNAHVLAREMTDELRKNYKLQAYVYNHGAEEKRKEYARVKALIEKQQEFFRQNGQGGQQGSQIADPFVRVSYVKIEEQCAVLVGGYPDEHAAKRELDALRRRPAPDANKVKLNIFSVLEYDVKTKKKEQVNTPVNPFSQAFVCRNPAYKQDSSPQQNTIDIAILKRLNADESFSLLQCKKPLTLAVKQFQTDSLVTSKSTTGAFLENLKMGGKPQTGERVDGAAHNAHNVAEVLRKMSFKAYVLHTKHASIISVGEFDSVEDPNLRAMQEMLADRLSPRAMPYLACVQFFPRPMPMQVPR